MLACIAYTYVDIVYFIFNVKAILVITFSLSSKTHSQGSGTYMHACIIFEFECFYLSNINHKALTFYRINVAFYSFDSTQK